jgi:hypothetical protein
MLLAIDRYATPVAGRVELVNWFLSNGRAMRALIPLAVWLSLVPLSLGAQTAFVYRGHLLNSGVPAEGFFDLQFALTDAAEQGSYVANAVTNLAVPVSNGVFSVTLDFGAAFDGSPRWLEIGVRSNATDAGFTLLSPRQGIGAVPYAIFAGSSRVANVASNLFDSGASLTNIPASSLKGTVPPDRLAGITSLQMSPETDAAYRATDTNIVRRLVRTTPPQGRVTPYDFGAKGDGIADDTVALQAWIDMAQASNYVAELPPAEKFYRITDALLVRSLGGISIIGMGGQSHVTGDPMTRSRIHQATYGKHGIVITNASGLNTPSDNIFLQGFALSAQTYCPTNYGIAFQGGIPDSDVDVIMNVGVRGFGVGLFNGSGCNISVISCSFGGGADGIQINGPVVNSVMISSTICTGNRSNALNILSAGNVTFDTGDLVSWAGSEARLVNIQSGTVTLRNINGEHQTGLEAIRIWSPKRNASVILDGGTIALSGGALRTSNTFGLSISNASAVIINGTKFGALSSDGFPIAEYQSPPVANSLYPLPEKIVVGSEQQINWISGHMRTFIPRFDGTSPNEPPFGWGMPHEGLLRVLNNPGETELQVSAYMTPYNGQTLPVYVPLLQYAKDKLTSMTVKDLRVTGNLSMGASSGFSGSIASYPNVITRMVFDNGVIKNVDQESWDTDATAYCSRAGLTNDPLEMAAVDTLTKGLKAQGLWGLADAIYLFHGPDLSSAGLNLVSADYPVQWKDISSSSFARGGVPRSGAGSCAPGLGLAKEAHPYTNPDLFFAYVEGAPNPGSHFLESDSTVAAWWSRVQRGTDDLEGTLTAGFCSDTVNKATRPLLPARLGSPVAYVVGRNATDVSFPTSTAMMDSPLGVLCSLGPNAASPSLTTANLRAVWIGGGLSAAQGDALVKCFDQYLGMLGLKSE